VQQYHKSRNLVGHDIAISRYLPKDLAPLLFVYLHHIRTLEKEFCHQLFGPEAAATCGTYLFVRHGKRMTSDQIRSAVSSALSAHLKANMPFSSYR